MARLITEAQVIEMVNPNDVLEAIRQAHVAMGKGLIDNVARTRARSPKMSLHSLSATSVDLAMACSKVYSATRQGVKALVILFDLNTGDVLALIEASALGQLRTAAAGLLSSQLMLGKLPPKIALIGTGFQAWGLARALNELARVEGSSPEVHVSSRNAVNTDAFVNRATKELSLKVIKAENAESAVHQAELLLTVTTSSSPVFEHEWLKSTRHIAALGSNALSRQEIPPQTVSGSRLLFVDCKETSKREGGNLLKALENGKIYWSQIKELSDLLLEPEKFLRQGSGGYSLFCSHGLAVQDLYLAKLIYSRAAKTSCAEIPLFA